MNALLSISPSTANNQNSFQMVWQLTPMATCTSQHGADRKWWKSIQRKFCGWDFKSTEARCLWGMYFCYCSTGNVEFEIPFPCKQVTSAAFGGPNLDILYVTTAGQARTEAQSKEAGHLFQVTGLNATGTNGVRVRLWIANGIPR